MGVMLVKTFLARLFGGRAKPVESPAADAADYLVLVQVGEGAEPVPMTLGDLLECDTREKLLQRAAEKTDDAAKRADRRIIDHLKSLGVPEDISRYKNEEGTTTLYYRLGGLRGRKPTDPSDEG